MLIVYVNSVSVTHFFSHSCTDTSRIRYVSDRIRRIRKFFPVSGFRYRPHRICTIRISDTYPIRIEPKWYMWGRHIWEIIDVTEILSWRWYFYDFFSTKKKTKKNKTSKTTKKNYFICNTSSEAIFFCFFCMFAVFFLT